MTSVARAWPDRAMAAVPGGFAMGDGETRAGAISYAVQMYALKGEDKFVAVPDVFCETGDRPPSARRAKAKRGARAAGASGAADEEDAEDFDAARSGDFLSCFAVFDGHVNATASSHCERAVLNELLRCGADAPDAPLESACASAFERVERSYASAGSCFPSLLACIPASRGGGGRGGKAREGGTTASVVCVQRRRPDAGGEPRVDVVAANAGDSGSLLVHFKAPIVGQPSRSPRLTAEIRKSIDEDAATAPDMPDFRRLTRDHNPDDPFEARRLVDAGARLGRMRQGGEEVGPMRTYPGGLAVSRAIGDLNAPAVICRPGARAAPCRPGRPPVLAAAACGTLGHAEVATVAHGGVGGGARRRLCARSCRRGAHDDITIVVVDVPPAGRRGPPRGARAGAPGAGTGGGDRTHRRGRKRRPAGPQRGAAAGGRGPPRVGGDARGPGANRGGKFDVQADVTVRGGLAPGSPPAALPRRTPRGGAGTPGFT